MNKPVVDQTGLTCHFNFKLYWVAAANLDSDGGVSIFGAVEKLGLKLDSKKLAVPVVVIDHAEKHRWGRHTASNSKHAR